MKSPSPIFLSVAQIVILLLFLAAVAWGVAEIWAALTPEVSPPDVPWIPK